MIKKIRLVTVEIKETKDGQNLKNKKGEPYKMCVISGPEGKKASMYIGMWQGKWDKKLDVVGQWKVGDEVEVSLEQQGEYLNFSLPTNEDRLEARIAVLENAVFRDKGASRPIYPESPVKTSVNAPQEPVDIVMADGSAIPF